MPDIRQLRTLEVLDVSSNQFQTLAKNLDYLYTLRHLNVANNKLVARDNYGLQYSDCVNDPETHLTKRL